MEQPETQSAVGSTRLLGDGYTGRELDAPQPLMQPNGGRCDTCGTETIDRCPHCGDPQCCPHCCAEARAEATRYEDEQSKRSGLAHTHGLVA